MCLNVSTTSLQQWGFRQCLPFSLTTLRDKHCRHPIALIGIQCMLLQLAKTLIRAYVGNLKQRGPITNNLESGIDLVIEYM